MSAPEYQSTFWLLALPLEGRLERGEEGTAATVKVLNERLGDAASCLKFALPDLRVGTLDALLTLSDDLVKTGSLVEAVAAKIRRTLGDLEPDSAELSMLAVEGLPLRRFLNSFVWNEAKHPARRPLRETADRLAEGVARLEEELKGRSAEYNALKGALSAAGRKAGGSLASRDLGDLLSRAPRGCLVESEHLTTLLVVVPSHQAADWGRRYETLAPLVVPRSSRALADEQDYGLHTAVLFRKSGDAFRAACREKGWAVRDAAAVAHARAAADAAAARPGGPGTAAAAAADAARLAADAAASRASLAEWCRTAFGEALSSLVHLCALRLFVESILRYGLPPRFAAVLCAPDRRAEKRARAALAACYGRAASAHWRAREEDAAKGEEVHPYVSVTLTLP